MLGHVAGRPAKRQKPWVDFCDNDMVNRILNAEREVSLCVQRRLKLWRRCLSSMGTLAPVTLNFCVLFLAIFCPVLDSYFNKSCTEDVFQSFLS